MTQYVLSSMAAGSAI